MEEKPMYGGLTVYGERGAYLRRLEQYDKSKAAYDEALKFSPDDVRLLMGRSQVCADVMEPLQAYNDAEKALKIEPNNLSAKSMQARAHYTFAEFEKSAASNCRGYDLRKQPPYFKEGFDQGVATIEDCIGKYAGQVLLNFLPIIKQQQSMMTTTDDDEYAPMKRVRVSRIPQEEKVERLTQWETRKKLTLSRVLANKYLGPMAYDKLFLQELKEHPHVPSANASGSKEIKDIVDEALSSLTTRQEMLRAQRPYYTIRLAEKAESKRQNVFKKQVLKNQIDFVRRNCDRYIIDLHRYFGARLISTLMTKAEGFQGYLDRQTPTVLPEKMKYMEKLYKIVGEAYLSQYRISYARSERGNRRRVAFLMGMKVGRPSSYDSVIAAYPHRYDTVTNATNKLSHMLDVCESDFQKLWLQYELSLLANQQKNFSLAKFYAKCCMRDAAEQDDAVWWVNGSLAMMRGELQQGNANEICALIDEALPWVNKLYKRPEVVLAFLMKLREIALEPVVADDRQATLKREQEILHVMDDQVRGDARYLFRRMSTVPPGRKFSVLPFKQGPKDSLTAERRRYKQTRLTVVPGKEKPLWHPPKAAVRGFQVFDI